MPFFKKKDKTTDNKSWEERQARMAEVRATLYAAEAESQARANAPARPSAARTGDRSLWLMNASEKPIQAIKIVREIAGLDIMDAKRLVDAAPSLVIDGISEADAKIYAGLFEAENVRAQVEIR